VKLFYENIDTPGLYTLAVYQESGGYEMLARR
jgi:hypothetical protein